MSTKPPAVGDDVYRRVLESVPMPDGRGNIVTTINGILSGGGVQKLTIEIGRPIRIERLVKGAIPTQQEQEPDEDSPPPEVDDLMSLIRNGEMKDFPQMPKIGPYTYLFQVFHILSQKRLKPKTLLVHTIQELQHWLNLDGFLDITEVYGVDVVEHPAIPEFTGLLMADVPPTEVAFCVRLTMEPKEKSNEADRGEGTKERNSGQRNGRAPGKVGKPS